MLQDILLLVELVCQRTVIIIICFDLDQCLNKEKNVEMQITDQKHLYT